MDLFIRAARDRRIDAHNVAIKAAYWGARWGREKTMTSPAEVMIDSEAEAAAKRVAQTPDDHIAALDAWVLATGGTLDPPKKRRGKRKES